jgi:2-polyprenyl-3-methyl-5-hydroxy-6-metoxy-1,4-benzoquinol methylase
MIDQEVSSTNTHKNKNVYYQNTRPEIITFLPEIRTRALEIGCGEGYFLGTLEGPKETWAVEVNPAVARCAESRIGRVLIGEFETVRHELPKAYFDVVICNDVIEHMIDHERFLSQISEHIAPGGSLVGSIPNVRYYKNIFELVLEKDWRYRESGTLDATHLRFFTEKSLRFYLEKSNFKVDLLCGINKFHDNTSKRDKIYMYFAKIISFFTLRYMEDLSFLQFGFRATLK